MKKNFMKLTAIALLLVIGVNSVTFAAVTPTNQTAQQVYYQDGTYAPTYSGQAVAGYPANYYQPVPAPAYYAQPVPVPVYYPQPTQVVYSSPYRPHYGHVTTRHYVYGSGGTAAAGVVLGAAALSLGIVALSRR